MLSLRDRLWNSSIWTSRMKQSVNVFQRRVRELEHHMFSHRGCRTVVSYWAAGLSGGPKAAICSGRACRCPPNGSDGQSKPSQRRMVSLYRAIVRKWKQRYGDLPSLLHCISTNANTSHDWFSITFPSNNVQISSDAIRVTSKSRHLGVRMLRANTWQIDLVKECFRSFRCLISAMRAHRRERERRSNCDLTNFFKRLTIFPSSNPSQCFSDEKLHRVDQ